jgi:hypothetical protein
MRSSERVVGVLIAAMTLVMFGTPLRIVWADEERPWWTVFAVWAAAIASLVALAIVSRARRRR